MIQTLLLTLLQWLEQLTALEFIAIIAVLTLIIIILSGPDVPPPNSGIRHKRIMRGLNLFIRSFGLARPASGEQNSDDSHVFTIHPGCCTKRRAVSIGEN